MAPDAMASNIAPEHPLTLEIKSLRDAVSHYQHSSHASAVQLQRQALEFRNTIERSKLLEHENARLKEEINILRNTPDTTPHPVTLQVSELTLAHRRLSEKLSLVEQKLIERNKELSSVANDKLRTEKVIRAAHKLAKDSKVKEDEARTRERQVEMRAKAAEEERRMTDVVVCEYADLVKYLEGRPGVSTTTYTTNYSSSSTSPTRSESKSPEPSSPKYATLVSTPLGTLSENRAGFKAVLLDFNNEVERLQAELSRLTVELGLREAELEAEKAVGDGLRDDLARSKVQLEQYKADDTTASKLVSRYMKFSQSAIDLLQQNIDGTKARYQATLSSVSSHVSQLDHSLTAERAYSSRLRDALDELTEDISRETYGRRREVALRLALIEKEEKVVESLRRWKMKSEEGLRRVQSAKSDEPATVETILKAFENSIHTCARIFKSIEGDEPSSQASDSDYSGGSLARIVAAEDTVRSLLQELQRETDRRMLSERKTGQRVQSPEAATPAATPIPLLKPFEILSPPSSAKLQQSESVPFPSSEKEGIASSTTFDRTEGLHSIHNNSKNPPLKGLSTPPPTSSPFNHSPVTPPKNNLLITPLISQLKEVLHRYDAVQRSFRDAHFTLSSLKSDIIGLSPDSTAPSSPDSGISSGGLSTWQLLQAAIDRLDDFNEDARVELEIRIADEARMANGFETLLSLPDALHDAREKEKVMYEIQSFIDGTSEQILKAKDEFKRKLEDVQHDIAALKRAVHDTAFPSESSAPAPSTPPTPQPRLSWTAWTSGLIPQSPSRPASPAPTFGSVMTSLNRPPSANHSPRFPSSSLDFSPEAPNSPPIGFVDPLSRLGLRIAMPSFNRYTPAPTPTRSFFRVRTSSSPRKAGSGPGVERLARTRSTSGFYLMGLGVGVGASSREVLDVPESDEVEPTISAPDVE